MEDVGEDALLPTWSTCWDGWAKSWSGTPTVCTTTRVLYHGRVFGAYLGFSVILINSITDIQVGSVRPGRKTCVLTEKTEGGMRKARLPTCARAGPMETSYFYILIHLFCSEWPISTSPYTGRSSPYQILESLGCWPHAPGYCLCTDVFNLSLNLAIRSSWSEP